MLFSFLGEATASRPTCDNHDDGETLAIILCDHCGNLCADCDRFLHLHRKTKGHQRQVFKEEEDAIKVDLHEGCGRTKLFWLMALADSLTLKVRKDQKEAVVKALERTSFSVSNFCERDPTLKLKICQNVTLLAFFEVRQL